PVLMAALVGGGITLGVMPFAPNVAALAIVALAFSAFYGVVSPMVFGLLATEVPVERRSQTLNLVYLPLYLAGVIGPTLGALVVSAGAAAPFLLGGAVFIAGSLAVARQPGPAVAALEWALRVALGEQPERDVLDLDREVQPVGHAGHALGDLAQGCRARIVGAIHPVSEAHQALAAIQGTLDPLLRAINRTDLVQLVD